MVQEEAQAQARDLCQLLSELVKSSPRRTCPSLAWDGSIQGYEQRPASADVPVPASHAQSSQSATTSVDALLQQLLHLLAASKGQRLARALHKAGILAQLSAVCSFATPSTVLLAEQLYGTLALACTDFRQEALQDGDVHTLLGLLLHTHGSRSSSSNSNTTGGGSSSSSDSSSRTAALSASSAVQLAALERLAGALDAATGQEFMHWLGQGGGLESIVRMLQQPSDEPADAATMPPATEAPAGDRVAATSPAMVKAGKQVFLACLQRTRRMKGVTSRQAPRLGYWSKLSPTQVLQLEQAALNRPQQPCAADYGVDQATAATAASGVCVAASSQGCVARPGGKAGAKDVSSHAYDEDGVRVMWDNAPSAEDQAARQAWKATPLSDKLSWTQTATDLDVRLLLPAGTKKRDLSVTITPQRLTVCLGWHGRVLDGPLAGRIKSRAALWVIEAPTPATSCSHATSAATPSTAYARTAYASTAPKTVSSSTSGGETAAGNVLGNSEAWPVLQLLLPKDDAGHFWRGLFEGGEEKSHWQILQEAMQCSDTDAQDDAAAGMGNPEVQSQAALLVAQLRERQALVASGELDLENGFDDFRVVLGDAGL